MPIYTYICRDCGEKFDILIGVTSEKKEVKCEKCNSKNIQRTLNSFSVGGSNNRIGSSGSSCPTGICNL